MSASNAFKILALCFCAVQATPLQVEDDQTLAPTAAQNLTLSILKSNASPSVLNGSSENANVQCDSRYGLNPTLSDCENARHHLLPGSDPIIFGERHTPGLPETAIALPYLLFGGMILESQS